MYHSNIVPQHFWRQFATVNVQHMQTFRSIAAAKIFKYRSTLVNLIRVNKVDFLSGSMKANLDNVMQKIKYMLYRFIMNNCFNASK